MALGCVLWHVDMPLFPPQPAPANVVLAVEQGFIPVRFEVRRVALAFFIQQVVIAIDPLRIGRLTQLVRQPH
ncbi:hypothetical protein D3C75_1285570 [compost metagenome]